MKVGIVGWRGMVGSVLLQRMEEEKDFSLGFEPVFFSTSQAGAPAPLNAGTLKNASDIEELKKLDVIITCQGGGDRAVDLQDGRGRVLEQVGD